MGWSKAGLWVLTDAGPLQTSCPPRPRPRHWQDSWREKQRRTSVGVIFPGVPEIKHPIQFLHLAIALISLTLFWFLRGIKSCQHIYLHCSHYVICFFSPSHFHFDFHFMSVQDQGNKVSKDEKTFRPGGRKRATGRRPLKTIFSGSSFYRWTTGGSEKWSDGGLESPAHALCAPLEVGCSSDSLLAFRNTAQILHSLVGSISI